MNNIRVIFNYNSKLEFIFNLKNSDKDYGVIIYKDEDENIKEIEDVYTCTDKGRRGFFSLLNPEDQDKWEAMIMNSNLVKNF